MAIFDIDTAVAQINAIEWTGTNVDAIVTHLAGATSISYTNVGGVIELRVGGTLVAAGDNVAKKVVGGAFAGVLNDTDLAALYNPGV